MDPDEPQKPVSTTNGEQTAGHSYSTRSKANKRISNSDDDINGAQSDQPTLKRQATRLRSKQAGKSAKIQNNDSTPDSDPINDASTADADECTPSEIALRNHLVLESLLKNINRSDLLSCRIVNKQWQYEVTKELRRRNLALSFSFQYQGSEVSRKRKFRDFCRRLSDCKTPSLLSTFQVVIDARNDLGSAGVGNIFTTVGSRIKHLTLHLNYLDKTSAFENRTLMTHLQNLLCRQAPNLEFLEIDFHFPGHWKYQMQAPDSPDHHQLDDHKFRLLPNLKTFIVKGTPPPNFFADVMNAAVNLRSVGGVLSTLSYIAWVVPAALPAGGDRIPLRGLSSACIKYFLGADGRDKIHLLKKFSVYLAYACDAEYDERDIELIGKFLTEHKENLKLETFECVSREFDEELSFAPGIVGVINQILEGSAGSLLNLRIEPAKWFKDLLIIPRLPKLRRICFDCFWSSCMGLDLDGGGGFFPHGFNMNSSFPNVSTIVLLRCDVPFIRLFVERMGIEIKEPVPSIRRIFMFFEREGSDVLLLASDFHHVFPNLVSVSYVDGGKYYKI